MAKVDYKAELKHLYRATQKPAVVDVPRLSFLMADGAGDPNTAPAYQEAVEAIFSLAYTIKFLVKKGPQAIDYGVMPLEGRWWADDMTAFHTGRKGEWQWTLMILQPEVVTPALVREAAAQVARKKDLPALAGVRFEPFAEGKAAQILHVGPFTEEGPTITALHRFIADQGRQPRGQHHEIYLSDIRKTAPAKWKTILRQPMA